MPRIPSRPPLDLSGKWVVAELPSMMEDYLGLTPDPRVLITHTEFERFSATFQFGAQQGEIDGRVDEVWTHAAAIFFTFVGTDEGDEVSGAAADAGYNAADDTITGTMRYHLGEDGREAALTGWQEEENVSSTRRHRRSDSPAEPRLEPGKAWPLKRQLVWLPIKDSPGVP